jgi:hypothetical protein
MGLRNPEAECKLCVADTAYFDVWLHEALHKEFGSAFLEPIPKELLVVLASNLETPCL